MRKQKTIIAQLSTRETKTDQFLKLASIMVNKSITENGCIAYKLLKDVSEENEFLIYEKYENDKAVEEHKSSEHFKSFLNSILPLLAKDPIIGKF